jgi:hypothetical protein
MIPIVVSFSGSLITYISLNDKCDLVISFRNVSNFAENVGVENVFNRKEIIN